MGMRLFVIAYFKLCYEFTHTFFARQKKTLVQPRVTIHIGSATAGVARPLPILSAYPCGDVDGNCIIVYGSLVRPGFEKMVSMFYL